MVRILDSRLGAEFPRPGTGRVRESALERAFGQGESPMRKLALVALAGLLGALPAEAGVTFTTTMHTEGGARGSDMNDMTIKVQVSGDKARGDIQASKSPFFADGGYELTRDGGQTILFVNPKDKTFFDATKMLRGAAGTLNAMGGLMKMDVSDVKVEKLLEEDGGTVAGVPTTHYRYKTHYVMSMKMAFINSVSNVDVVEDKWTTTAISEAGFGLTQARSMKLGVEAFDKLIAAEMEKMKGFPVKSVSVTTTESKGRTDTRTLTREVTDLKTGVSVPDSVFTVPAGFQEHSPLPAGFPGGDRGN
jgi:hypothetical protein